MGQIDRFLQRASLPQPVIDAPEPNRPVLSAATREPITPDTQAPSAMAVGATLLAAAEPMLSDSDEN